MSPERINSSLVSSLVFPRGFFGLLALAVSLALTSPGVQIARAEDDLVSPAPADMTVDPALVAQAPPASPANAGPSGRGPGAPSVLQGGHFEQQTQRLQREIMRRASAARSNSKPGEDGVVLNGRGYNYRSAQSAKVH